MFGSSSTTRTRTASGAPPASEPAGDSDAITTISFSLPGIPARGRTTPLHHRALGVAWEKRQEAVRFGRRAYGGGRFAAAPITQGSGDDVHVDARPAVVQDVVRLYDDVHRLRALEGERRLELVVASEVRELRQQRV